jgi:CheY-like chemotaxis protein
MSASAPGSYRILVAEQDHQIRELLIQLLHLEGYETDEAATLDGALAKVDESSYDLVLTDLFAPPPTLHLEGINQLQARCRPIPVGILTGWRVDKSEIERAGIAFVMAKPFDIDVLLQQIADRLNPRFTPEQQQQANLVRRYLAALSQGDWAALRLLCTPRIGYYLLTRSLFTARRGFIGIEQYLDYVQSMYTRLPGLQIDRVVIFQHPKGLIARCNVSWQQPEGQRQGITGSMVFHFLGERISQIGEALNAPRLRKLLESAQEEGRA